MLAAGPNTPAPERAPPTRSFMLLAALALGLFHVVESTDFERPQAWAVLLLLAGALLVVPVLRGTARAAWAVLVYAVAVGAADRLARTPVAGSDVIAVTREAIGVLFGGGNPYTHIYLSSNPPASPFPYPPGEILFYAIPAAIFGDIRLVDAWAGIGVLVLLATLAAVTGPARAAVSTALYGTFGLAAFRSVDGSNDTALAFLVVLASALLALALGGGPAPRVLFVASAVAFAWAILFKQLSWVLYPFVLAHLRKRGADWRLHGAIALGLAALVLLPFVWLDPAALWRSFSAALTFHQNVWGLNVWAVVRPAAPAVVDALAPYLSAVPVAAMAVAGAFFLRRPSPDLGVALLQSAAVLFIGLFTARWTTSPYYTFAGAVLATAIALAGERGRATAVEVPRYGQ
jgi:hypothetical protein